MGQVKHTESADRVNIRFTDTNGGKLYFHWLDCTGTSKLTNPAIKEGLLTTSGSKISRAATRSGSIVSVVATIFLWELIHVGHQGTKLPTVGLLIGGVSTLGIGKR